MKNGNNSQPDTGGTTIDSPNNKTATTTTTPQKPQPQAQPNDNDDDYTEYTDYTTEYTEDSDSESRNSSSSAKAVPEEPGPGARPNAKPEATQKPANTVGQMVQAYEEKCIDNQTDAPPTKRHRDNTCSVPDDPPRVILTKAWAVLSEFVLFVLHHF